MKRFASGLRSVSCLFVFAAITAPAARAADEPAKPVRALLVIGGGYHDYAKQKDILTKGLTAGGKIEVTLAYDASKEEAHPNEIYKKADWSKGFDVVIHDECTASVRDLDLINNTILKPHREGLGAVVLHCGMHSYRTDGWNVKGKGSPWMEFTGLQTTGHGAQIPIGITFVDKESPISTGMADWTTMKEELYNNFAGDLMPTAHALARGKQSSKNRAGDDRTEDFVVAWTNTYSRKSKVFCTTLGHNNETVADPRYLDLVSRGILWAAGRDAKPTAITSNSGK